MNKNNFVILLLSVFLLTIAMITLYPTASMELENVSNFKEYVSSGNYFKCSIPTEWSISDSVFGLSEDDKKVYGFTILGPRNRSAVYPQISIHYYALGNRVHKTMDKYIKLHSQSVFGNFVEEGESYGEVRQIELAGRKAKTFERIVIEYIGHERINPSKVSIFEKFIVIPAMKDDGFYVLKLSGPAETKEKYTEIFEVTVKSFLPAK